MMANGCEVSFWGKEMFYNCEDGGKLSEYAGSP